MPLQNPNKTTLYTVENLDKEHYIGLIAKAVVVGACTGIFIGIFRKAYGLINKQIVTTVTAHLDTLAFEIGIFVALIALALFAGKLSKKEPFVRGSGIPQMELALEGKLPFPWLRIAVFKFVGTLTSLLGGLSVGREGPSIQMGSAIGCGVSRLFLHTPSKRKDITPLYVLAGGVSGLSAAFCAPLAGILFAFEELRVRLTPRIFLFTAVASFSAWLVIKELFGFGLVFTLSTTLPLSLDRMWLPLLVGAFSGSLGALYNTLLLKVIYLHDSKKYFSAQYKPLVPFLLSGLFLLFYPQVLVGFGLSIEDIAGVRSHGVLILNALAFLLLCKVCFSILSFSSGVPGGLLMPVLAIGSIVGTFFGQASIDNGFFTSQYLPTFLLLGMSGFFSGSIRAPFTGAVLIAEMSGTYQCFPEILISSLIGTLVANFLRSTPVYDSLKDRAMNMVKEHQLSHSYLLK